ncbi:hypothetical protein JTE90_004294 [Oedothorax gibbosus]|uniref:MSP domain-containing protein n=1 Tax=Oedothorax gibbosus TaxID=931172 RepID=A0AAV6VLD3_9ARAC|nr:hypothetical protein JTE90_004294 [Oedothorax gibbosus]
MSKAEQVLVLDPPMELHFKGPFQEVTTSHLKLTNPTDRQIGFKVKTTAPKTYCVRPNGGIIQPKKTVSVAVMLQPFDPENDDRSRDKFMVQSMYVPEGDVDSDTMWHDVPSEGLMNSKLKCIFDISTDTNQVTADVVDQPKATEVKVIPVKAKPAEPMDPWNEQHSHNIYEEYKKLKAELNELKTENSSLKEEGLRSRVAQDTRIRATSAKPSEPESLSQNASKPLASNYLVLIAVLVLLLGIYIGKTIL